MKAPADHRFDTILGANRGRPDVAALLALDNASEEDLELLRCLDDPSRDATAFLADAAGKTANFEVPHPLTGESVDLGSVVADRHLGHAHESHGPAMLVIREALGAGAPGQRDFYLSAIRVLMGDLAWQVREAMRKRDPLLSVDSEAARAAKWVCQEAFAEEAGRRLAAGTKMQGLPFTTEHADIDMTFQTWQNVARLAFDCAYVCDTVEEATAAMSGPIVDALTGPNRFHALAKPPGGRA